MELDSEALFAQFQIENSQRLKNILSRGTYLDEQDISRLLELSFPGLDELMALIKMMELLNRTDYDLLILDTAPTGHTLRLLDLPILMQEWVKFLDLLMAKHRYMSRVYTRTYKPDDADDFINVLAGELQEIRKLLQDKRRCRFVPIATLEPVVLSETQRLLSTLTEKGIPVKDVLINQVVIDFDKLNPADLEGCERCRATAEAQGFQLEAFRKEWPHLHVSLLPMLRDPLEVKGEEGLKSFVTQSSIVNHQLSIINRQLSIVNRQSSIVNSISPRVQISLPGHNTELVLFCGKGGVGKTTLSSAFAIQFSRRFPDKKILLFSIDPAHSLSDCVGERIGAGETQVGSIENLFALELNPELLFREFKASYAQQIEAVFEGVSRRADRAKQSVRSHRGMAVQFDKEVLTQLLSLAPPGIDEIMALSKLADYVEQKSYDLYVLDAAPTGHALRFLELPHLVQEWLKTFFEIILKYKRMIRLPKTSELLIEMSKKVKRIQQLLSDPERCECILVSIPTEMALRETQRLVLDLTRLGIPIQRLMLNRMVTAVERVSIPTGDCRYCDSLASTHELMHLKFKEAFRGLEIVTIPQWAGEVRGIDTLSSLINFVGVGE